MAPSHPAAADANLLFTSLYRLTMAQVYLRQGLHELPARLGTEAVWARLPAS